MTDNKKILIQVYVNGVPRGLELDASETKHLLRDLHAVLDTFGFGKSGKKPLTLPSVISTIARRMVYSGYRKDAPYSSLARLAGCTKSSVRHYAIKNVDALENSMGLMFTHNWCKTGRGFPITACLNGRLMEMVAEAYIAGDDIESISDAFGLPEHIIEKVISELAIDTCGIPEHDQDTVAEPEGGNKSESDQGLHPEQ